VSERFFSDEPITGGEATLVGAEAHHLLHVMRLKEGAHVALFDGGGAEFEAEVTACRRGEVRLAVRSRRDVDRELRAPLVLGVALPKGDRQKWLVEKLTELGVTRLVPLATERSVVRPSGGALAKLRRAVVEACKQCGRNRLMEVREEATLRAFFHDGAAEATQRLIAHPGGGAAPSLGEPAPTWCAIGPEGGFTDEEVARAREAGWQVVVLGPRMLRVETAALALAARLAAGL